MISTPTGLSIRHPPGNAVNRSRHRVIVFAPKGSGMSPRVKRAESARRAEPVEGGGGAFCPGGAAERACGDSMECRWIESVPVRPAMHAPLSPPAAPPGTPFHGFRLPRGLGGAPPVATFRCPSGAKKCSAPPLQFTALPNGVAPTRRLTYLAIDRDLREFEDIWGLNLNAERDRGGCTSGFLAIDDHLTFDICSQYAILRSARCLLPLYKSLRHVHRPFRSLPP